MRFVWAAALLGACTGNDGAADNTDADTLVVYVAASLTRPLQPVLSRFAAQEHVILQRESGASLEHVRKITELHRIPDLIILADAEIFPELLLPRHVSWYAEFARNRMIVAYRPQSKHASEVDSTNWTRILSRPDVQVGRTDPDLAPAGYRTLMLFQLAERHYKKPGLAAALLANAPERNIRANAADLAALLQAGELDYIYDYQSVAESNRFRFVQLPREIDLGDPSRAAGYASARVKLRGATSTDTIERSGQPILYALSIPTGARHPATARRFLKRFFAPEATSFLRAGRVDMLDRPVVVGTGAPPELSAK